MQKFTLYTHPFSRGTYAVWMLKECGADYDVKLIQFGKQIKSPEYLAVNPQAQVPALKVGDTVITETLAVISFLAEQFPEKNLIPPADSVARGEFYRWLIISVHLEYSLVDKRRKLTLSDDDKGSIGYGDPDVLLDVLRNHLKNREYIVGEHFTALDLYYSGLIVHFSEHMKILNDSVLNAYAARHTARPAFAETMAWAQQAAAQMPSEE